MVLNRGKCGQCCCPTQAPHPTIPGSLSQVRGKKVSGRMGEQGKYREPEEEQERETQRDIVAERDIDSGRDREIVSESDIER